MKRWIARGLLLLLLGLTATAFAGNLSGNVSGILRFENSPYSVVGPITVLPDSQLIIEPGVLLFFAQNSSLVVRGQLIVNGTRSQRVVFQAGEGQTWNGIRFENSIPNVSSLTNVEIRGTSNPLFVDQSIVNVDFSRIISDGSISINRSTVSLMNSHFIMTVSQTDRYVALDASDSDVQLISDTISVSSSVICREVIGVNVSQGTATLTSNVVQVNTSGAVSTYGLYMLSQDDASIYRNIIKVTSQLFSCVMKLENSGGNVHVYNNTIRLVSQSSNSFGMMIEDGRSIQIRNNVIWGNGFGKGIGGSNVNVVNADYSLIYNFAEPYYNIVVGDHDQLMNPLLDTVTYSPDAESPVIDRGDPNLPYDPDNTIPDIGAVPYYHVAVSEPNPALPSSITLAAWPNPFNASVSFTLPATGVVSWRIIDRTGRAVASGTGVADREYRSSWRPLNAASGWYLLEVVSTKGVARRNLCYLR